MREKDFGAVTRRLGEAARELSDAGRANGVRM
jgi:hypothetical protein